MPQHGRPPVSWATPARSREWRAGGGTHGQGREQGRHPRAQAQGAGLGGPCRWPMSSCLAQRHGQAWRWPSNAMALSRAANRYIKEIRNKQIKEITYKVTTKTRIPRERGGEGGGEREVCRWYDSDGREVQMNSEAVPSSVRPGRGMPQLHVRVEYTTQILSYAV